jgi:hypothetical protein
VIVLRLATELTCPRNNAIASAASYNPPTIDSAPLLDTPNARHAVGFVRRLEARKLNLTLRGIKE